MGRVGSGELVQRIVTHGRRVATRCRRTVAVVRARRLTFMAGSLAYAAFLSLVPVLVVVLAIAGTVRGEAWTGQLLALVERQLGPQIADVVAAALRSDSGLVGASAIGVVVFLWSATRVFRGLDIAVNAVYGASTGSMISTVRDGLLALGALAVAVAALVAAEIVLATVTSAGLLARATPLLLWGAITVLLLPVYVVLPDVDVGLAEGIPGALAVAGAWLLLSDVFERFVETTGDTAGLFGGIILLLSLLYVAMLVLLVGVAINAVLSGRATVPDDRSSSVVE